MVGSSRSCRRGPMVVLLVGLGLVGVGCSEALDGSAPGHDGQNFGEKFYYVICQRTAYSASSAAHQKSLVANQANPAVPIRPLDVSGNDYRAACLRGPAYLQAQARSRDPKIFTLVDGRGDPKKDPANRTLLVNAINTIFLGSTQVETQQEAKLLSDLQDYLVKILPLTDNDRFPTLVSKAATFIKTRVEPDQELHDSLARLTHRIGYRPRATALGITRELLGYPNLHPTLNTLLEYAGENGEGHQALMDLLDALAFELRTVQRADDTTRTDGWHQLYDRERPLALALDLLLKENKAITASGTPVLLARRDWRGVCKVLPDAQTGLIPAPFTDKNGDKQADIDALGQFITSDGKDPPSPFHHDTTRPDTAPRRDSLGRATSLSGVPLYEYASLESTLLGALAVDAVDLLNAKTDVAFNLVLGLSPLLGPRTAQSKKGLSETYSYMGFDTAKAPLMDLAHALFQTLRDPKIEATLEAAATLIQKHEGPMARLLHALVDAKDRGKAHPEATVVPTSNLWDDAIEVVQKIAAKKGLLEDLLKALKNPVTKNLSGMFANYMTYRDVHVLHPTLKDQTGNALVVTQGQSTATLASAVDRTKPDGIVGGVDNRSIQQRLMHIINNSNGMQICNKEGGAIKILGINVAGPFKECELFQVKNGAVLYTSSIARLRDSNGNLTSTPKGYLQMNLPSNIQNILNTIQKTFGVEIPQDGILEYLSGIKGMTTHPTTEALNRLMFMDKYPTDLANIQDPPLDIDKHLVPTYHKGSLLSWEVRHPQYTCSNNDPCTFFDALRPIVQAFADHNAEDLFVDLLSVMHRHWATRKSSVHQFTDAKAADFSYGSSLIRWEPLIAEVLEKTDLMPALNAVAPVLVDLKLADGSSALTELAKSIAFIVDPSASPVLAYRDGRTYAYKSDGKTKVVCGTGQTTCVTPFYLFADAFTASRLALRSCVEDCPTCGDGICSGKETALTCTVDCRVGCGNGVCDSGENASRCPADCTGLCGDRVCNRSESASGTVLFETSTSCPTDCPEACGDGICTSVEDRQKATADAWNSGLSDLADLFLAVTGSGSQTVFKKRNMGPIGAAVLDFLRTRVAAHRVAGDQTTWLSSELPKSLATSLGSPVVVRAADFLHLTLKNSKVHTAILDLMRHLLDAINQNQAFRSSLTGIADLAQLFIDDLNLVPVARILGKALSSQEGLILAALRFLQPSIAADTKKTLSAILKNAWSEQSPGQSPIQTLLDLATLVHRQNPGATTPYTGKDFAQAFAETRDFLDNGETGLKKFFEIVKDRCGGVPCTQATK